MYFVLGVSSGMLDDFTSRHFVGLVPSAVKLLPCAAPGPLDDGSIQHKLVLIGGYDPEQVGLLFLPH